MGTLLVSLTKNCTKPPYDHNLKLEEDTIGKSAHLVQSNQLLCGDPNFF